MKKYIFLDIDGVIATPEVTEDGMWGLSPEKQVLLGIILKETGAKIVLSSSWRKHSLEESIEYMKKRGFLYCDEIVGVTIRAYHYIKKGIHLSIPRGVEIKQWLDVHVIYPWYASLELKEEFKLYDEEGNFKKMKKQELGVDYSFVILDDDTDMLLEHKDNFINIDGMIGLTEVDIKRAIEILNKQKHMESVPVTLSAKDILNQVKTDYNIGNAWQLTEHVIVAAMERYAEYKNPKSKLNLEELESKLDENLGKETRETLTEWLKYQRVK